MNEQLCTGQDLPGLEVEPGLASAASTSVPAAPRVKPVDRSQLAWQTVDVERLIEEDHPARAIWALVRATEPNRVLWDH